MIKLPGSVLTHNRNTEVVIARNAAKDHMLSSKLDAATIEVFRSL